MTPPSLQEQCRAYIERHPHLVLTAVTNGIYRHSSCEVTDAYVVNNDDEERGELNKASLASHFNADYVRRRIAERHSQLRLRRAAAAKPVNSVSTLTVTCVHHLCNELLSLHPWRTAVYHDARRYTKDDDDVRIYKDEQDAIDHVVSLFNDRGFTARAEPLWTPVGEGRNVTYVPIWRVHVSL